MGELFRSEKMQLIQLFFQAEAAHDTLDELGQLGLVQFKDLNPTVNAFQRTFVTEVKRFDEMQVKLTNFNKEIIAENFEDIDDIIALGNGSEPVALENEELETRLEETRRELQQTNTNQDLLRRNYMELVDLQNVLEKDEQFFAGADASAIEGDESAFISEDPSSSIPMTYRGVSRLGFITGVVPHRNILSFERILWRLTRGNLYMKHSTFMSPIASTTTTEVEHEEKDVFIIFYQGDRAETRIRKICEAMEANLYPCPNSAQERAEMLTQVKARLRDLKDVFDKSVTRRRRILLSIARHMRAWTEQVKKEKAIYHTMNMCNYDIGRRCLIAEGWCPEKSLNEVRDALRRADERSGAPVAAILNTVRTKEKPPTFFRTNKFTASFQDIVNAYGMARYQEVNPGVFTIVSFPFLFGMMFGDVGHGVIMTIFAAFLCIKEDWLAKLKLNEMVRTCYDGRYMLLLMGIAATYCGALYNEVFAIPMDIFGSRWAFYEGEEFARDTHPAIAYPFGVDPAWKGAKNELAYYNSIKMKLSIIFGVVQMVFGILLSALNAIYFKKPYNFYFEFVPQLIFMLSIFGYMCFLILVKWCTNWAHTPAPGLLNLLINMFLSPGEIKTGDKLFEGQLYVQWLLMFLAAISVPWMLVFKPYLLRREHNRGYRALPESAHHDEEEEEEEEFDFGEIFIHQIIHTIEFVLGAISNTASYLRLWALSLAHSELATVFWERAFVLTLEQHNFIAIFVGFAIWAGMSAAVLLIMEALSAFLHALRLHWVEFQNKFYMGDGYAFVPFSYALILAAEENS